MPIYSTNEEYDIVSCSAIRMKDTITPNKTYLRDYKDIVVDWFDLNKDSFIEKYVAIHKHRMVLTEPMMYIEGTSNRVQVSKKQMVYVEGYNTSSSTGVSSSTMVHVSGTRVSADTSSTTKMLYVSGQ